MRFFRQPPPRVALAQPIDAPALAALYLRAWTDCGAELDPRLVEEQRVPLEEIEVWLKGGFEVYRVIQEGRMLGAIRCTFPASTCHLDRLAVAPELRRRGIGRALLDHAIGRARRAGVTRVWTELDPRLIGAVTLYRAAGFRESGRHAAHLSGPLILLELTI